MVTTPDARFRDTNSNFGTANKNLLATNFVSMLSKAAGKTVVWISHSYCSEFIQRGKFFLKIVLKFNLRHFKINSPTEENLLIKWFNLFEVFLKELKAKHRTRSPCR